MRSAGWIVATAVTVLLQCGLGVSQTSPSAEAIHIFVQARTPAGDPIDGLRKKDFQVNEAGQPVPVLSVVSPRGNAVPPSLDAVHVLLMISVYSDYASEDAIVDLLTKNVPEDLGNVRMAVCQRNGRLTDYVGSRAELVHQIKGVRFHREYFDDALSELGRFPGQRSLVYFTEHGVDIPPPLWHKAERVAALTYQVGGSKQKNCVAGSEGGASYTGGTVPMGDHFHYGTVDQGGVGILAPAASFLVALTKSIREVHVVGSLKEAYRSLTDDGRGYYDLTVAVPPATTTLDLQLDLDHDYQLTAQSYAPGGHVAPDIHLPTRQVSSSASTGYGPPTAPSF